MFGLAEEQSLALPASHLGAGDDGDDDDDATCDTDAAREDNEYEKVFHRPRETRSAYCRHRVRRPSAHYFQYIDKVKCWAKQTRRVITNATVVKKMTLWLTM